MERTCVLCGCTSIRTKPGARKAANKNKLKLIRIISSDITVYIFGETTNRRCVQIKNLIRLNWVNHCARGNVRMWCAMECADRINITAVSLQTEWTKGISSSARVHPNFNFQLVQSACTARAACIATLCPFWFCFCLFFFATDGLSDLCALSIEFDKRQELTSFSFTFPPIHIVGRSEESGIPTQNNNNNHFIAHAADSTLTRPTDAQPGRQRRLINILFPFLYIIIYAL